MMCTLFLSKNVLLSEVAEVGATPPGQGLELRDLLGLEGLVRNVDDERQDGVDLEKDGPVVSSKARTTERNTQVVINSEKGLTRKCERKHEPDLDKKERPPLSWWLSLPRAKHPGPGWWRRRSASGRSRRVDSAPWRGPGLTGSRGT